MNTRKNTQTLSRYLPLPILLMAALLFPSLSHATPYATGLTNNGPGTSISFRLNEANGIVTVIWTNLAGAFITNNFGSRTNGLITTNIVGGPVPGAFTVIVAKTNTPGYISGVAQQISTDLTTNGAAFSTNAMKFNFPRGVAVNKNPASPYFGRIYEANSGTGPVLGQTNLGDGIFIRNADFTDAVGQFNVARTAGITTFTNIIEGLAANSPWKLDIGEDDNLYISDFSTNTGTIYVTDPNVLTGTNVLVGLGTPSNPNALAPSANHGRIGSSIIAKGSTNAGNLVLYAIDSDNNTTSDGAVNHIIKWDIGSGPLPVDLTVGTVVTNMDNSTLLNVSGITHDLAAGPDGKYYTLQNRSDGNEGGIFVLNPNVDDGSAGFGGAADGKWDEVFDSRADSIVNHANGTTDILRLSRAVAISPDGNYMAVVRDTSDTWIIPLTNGIPDIGHRRLVATSTVLGDGNNPGRDVAFDAAGNLYVSSSAQLALRVFSPGYITRATTTSAGTFSVTNILPTQSVAITGDAISGAVTNAIEGSVDGVVTFSRVGDTNVALTVTYVLSGTANRGGDYTTNSLFGAGATNTLTFPVGVDTTNVTVSIINDAIGEVPETVIFTLQSSSNYVSAFNVPLTVVITDDGTDLPAISVKALGLGFYELLTNRPAKFALSIASVWGVDLSANIVLTGTAVSSVDYSNASSYVVTIPAGTTIVTNLAFSIDNAAIAANTTLIYSLAPGAGYTNVGVITVTNALRSDDLAALPLLFNDDFETNSAVNWKTNCVYPDNDATYAYDYSLDGIPSAPHTPGGATTKGLKLRAHLGTAATGTNGISTSPIGLVITNDYRLRFDAWLNFNGAAPGGGTGSSEFLIVGLGVSENRTNVSGSLGGTMPAVAGLPGSSVLFEMDGDGGFTDTSTSAGDFVVFTSGAPIFSNSVNYAASARDNFAAYYGEFGDIVVPAAQTGLFPTTQTGACNPGALAFTWHDVIATKVGSTFSLSIDGLPIMNVTYPTPLVGSNFSLGYMDPNASVTAVPQMNAAIIDNLTVEKLPLSTNALLTSLVLTPGTLNPAFSSGTTSYAATNANASNPVTVTATVSHPAATLQFKLNGGAFGPLTSGVASGSQTLGLNPAVNTLTVRVTAPDTVTVQDYTMNVLLLPSQTVPTLTNSVSGSTLTLSWAADHVGYSLQTQTNALSAGLGATWFPVVNSTSTNVVTVTVDPTQPTVFYRLVYP